MTESNDKFSSDQELFARAAEMREMGEEASSEEPPTDELAARVTELERQVLLSEQYLAYIEGRRTVQGGEPGLESMQEDAKMVGESANEQLDPYRQVQMLEGGADDLENMLTSGLMSPEQRLTVRAIINREREAAAKLRANLEASS